MSRTLSEHLNPENGPKRILSLSGGGIRGALTLGLLQKLESVLREKEQNPNLLLCDYFDLIGGTSTGAIIAAGLAVGKTVEEMRVHYMDLGGKIFGEKHSWWKPWETMKFLKAGYNHAQLESSLRDVLGEITLGSDQIKTGLCIIAKRADTNSVWHLMNHPRGQFYDSDQGQNKDIPLWQAVRASSAAPTYFVPQMINVGHSENAAFVDGGVSSANNPALQLLMVATMKGFPFHWEFGTDKLELVSLGTGYSIFKKQVGEIEDSHLLNWASSVPDMLMQDSNWENQLMLQWISKSPTAVELDLQKGDLKDDLLGNKALIKYLRYDVELSEENLNKLDLGHFDKKRVDDVVEMSNAHNRELLFDIGVQSSDQLKAEHF